MKVFPQLLLLAAMVSACASSDKQPQSATAAERNPTAAEELPILQDQYGDNRVVFCSEQTVSVHSDPNKCGEAMAKGARACTEMAGYFSGVLKIEKVGKKMRLIDKTGKVRHELTVIDANTYLLTLFKGTPDVKVTPAKLSDAERKFYARDCK